MSTKLEVKSSATAASVKTVTTAASGKDIDVADILDFVEAIAKSVEYQGYDPQSFFGVLKDIATAKNISEDELRADLIFACTVLFTRGAAITKSKVKERTSAEGFQRMTEFISRWGIISANPKGAKEVTVARMCGTVVHIAVKVANALLFKNLLRTTAEPVAGLVPSLCQPIMASIIPKTKPILYARFKLWSGVFSDVISTPGSRASRGGDRTDYTLVTYNSGYYKEPEREKITRNAYVDTPDEYYSHIGLQGSAFCVVCAIDSAVTARVAKVHKVTRVAKGKVQNGTDDEVFNAFLKIYLGTKYDEDDKKE